RKGKVYANHLFRNAKEIDANGADIDNTFVNGQNMTQSEFQTELELIVKKKRDPQSIVSNSSNGNENNRFPWWAVLIIVFGSFGSLATLYVLATNNHEHTAIPNQDVFTGDFENENSDETDLKGDNVLKLGSDNRQVVETGNSKPHITNAGHIEFALDSDTVGNQINKNNQDDIELGNIKA
ncbi:MAG: hypothetical protein VW397_03855, partial [Candidatus Margulisiibacteriota bacterium]